MERTSESILQSVDACLSLLMKLGVDKDFRFCLTEGQFEVILRCFQDVRKLLLRTRGALMENMKPTCQRKRKSELNEILPRKKERPKLHDLLLV